MFDTWPRDNPNLQSIEIGTVWNEWQDNWVGRPVEAMVLEISAVEEENKLFA